MREPRYSQHFMDHSRSLNQHVSYSHSTPPLVQGWRDRIVEWMNGEFERKSRGSGKKGERIEKITSVVHKQQEMEATDSIVFRPTSRRREINRAACIHRRIFQHSSLQDDDDDDEGCD